MDSLRGDQAFARLRSGRAGRVRTLSVRWLPLSPPQGIRVGLVTSKKVGKAVVRNRLRRRLREILRRMHLPSCELLVVAHPEAADVGFAELWRDLSHALKKSGLIQ